MSEAGEPGPGPGRGSWTSEAYVAEWSAADSLRDVLALPRRITAALVGDAGLPVGRIVDLGAGDGEFLAVLLEAFPEARGTWIDASPPMRERAKERLDGVGERVRFVVADVRDPSALPGEGADVIVSSRVIHHFDAATIRGLYRAAHDRLPPGGFLFNLDHFDVAPGWESRYRRVRDALLPRVGTRRPHEHDAPPQPLSSHLRWLEAAGFEAPDVPWRLFLTALVAARKPGG